VSHLDAVISARVGNEQSLGVYSIPDGWAFLLTLDHKAPPWADTLQSRGETNERNAQECLVRARAMWSDTKARLLAGIARARGWLDDLIAGRVLDIADLALREKRSVRSTAMLLSLAFLAPALVQAIADNRLPRGIGLTRLADLPSDWSEQFKALGLQTPR
jgi:hypothetical protein